MFCFLTLTNLRSKQINKNNEFNLISLHGRQTRTERMKGVLKKRLTLIKTSQNELSVDVEFLSKLLRSSSRFGA